MAAPIPEWLGVTETVAFSIMVGTFAYNRLVSWRRFNERTTSLENKFEVFARDFDLYIKTCETCRGEVRRHHESSLLHVNDSFNDRLADMAVRIRNVEALLMEWKRNGGSK